MPTPPLAFPSATPAHIYCYLALSITFMPLPLTYIYCSEISNIKGVLLYTVCHCMYIVCRQYNTLAYCSSVRDLHVSCYITGSLNTKDIDSMFGVHLSCELCAQSSTHNAEHQAPVSYSFSHSNVQVVLKNVHHHSGRVTFAWCVGKVHQLTPGIKMASHWTVQVTL